MRKKTKAKNNRNKKPSILNTRLKKQHSAALRYKAAEENLRRERDNLLNILNSMEDGVYIVDKKYNIQYLNPVLIKQFGRLRGRKCYAYFHNRKRVCPWCKNLEVFKSKTVRWEWHSFKNKKTYDLIDTPFKNTDGSISKLEIFRDITERKQGEEEIRKAAREWGVTFNSITDFIFTLDSKFRFVRVNRAFSDFLKVKPEELLGKKCYEVLHKTKRPWPGCPGLEVFKDGKAHTREINDPKIRTSLLVTASPIFDNKGKIIGIVHTSRDISEHKRTEKAIKQQKDFIERAINAFNHPFYVINLDYTIALANKAAKERGIVEGGICYKLTHGRKAPCAGKHKCPLLGVIRTKKSVRIEHTHYDEEGNKSIIELYGEPIFDEYGKLTQLIEYAIDVTERKMREEMLLEAYRELKNTQAQLIQAEKLSAVGHLASGVAHEVKNPLHIIIQGISYLEREVGPDKGRQSKVLGMIKDAVERSDKIIKGLLNFSRVAPLEINPRAINKVIVSSLDLVRKQINFKNIKVVKDFAPGLPLAMIDENQIKQVFINIILNSIRAMPKGGTLSIRAYSKKLRELKGGVGRRITDSFKVGEKALICEIEDTGVGIPKDKLHKVFDPFFTTSPVGEGTGLGLSIARTIIENHKGLISIESKDRKGTKVVIVLPVAKGG